MSRPRALVLVAPGTNRHHDVAFALDLAGAEASTVLLADAITEPGRLADAEILVVAGGFSYADALGAGRMWALELRHRLVDAVDAFVAAGKPVIGICNGFQVLTSAGLLPGALGHNVDGRFHCGWVAARAGAGRQVRLDRRPRRRWSVRSPTARAATSTPTRRRCTPLDRSPCATPAAPTPTARPPTSPGCATRAGWSSG